MKLGQTLIDAAVAVCGSQAELARRMGVYPADVNNLKTGKRPLSPELAAELADIAGEDARQAVIDAVIERNAGTRKGGALREILGKGLAAGVAAMWLFSYSDDSNCATEKIAKGQAISNALHIVLSGGRWLRGMAIAIVTRWTASPSLRCAPAP
jgi:DNA-binding transcriptional regulator YdaS (Cro superfamily)